MKKLLAILSALTLACAMLTVSALELDTVETSDEAVLQAVSTVIPDKYHPTYGELVMYTDFSGDDVSTPIYSNSNLIISDVTLGTAPDGTVCAVKNSASQTIVKIKTENNADRTYGDGTAMSYDLTYIIELYADLNSATAAAIRARYPEAGDTGFLSASESGVITANKKGFAKDGWATATVTQPAKDSKGVAFKEWQLYTYNSNLLNGVYVKSVSVYCKNGDMVVLKSSKDDKTNSQNVKLDGDTFVFPSFEAFPGNFTGYSWTDGTNYYAPGTEVAKSVVATKTFYPGIDKAKLHDTYGYCLTSWDFSTIWNSNYNSDTLFVNSAGDKLKLVGNGINGNHIVADPANASNKVLYKAADAITIGLYKRANDAVSKFDKVAKYTISFRAYLNSEEADATTTIGINNREAGSPVLTPKTWENKIVSLTQTELGSIQIYCYNKELYYDDLYVWCYPSDALIIRANENDTVNAAMLYADGETVFPDTIGGESVDLWTDGESVYPAGYVIPEEACGKTWTPGGTVPAPECVDNEDYPISYTRKIIDGKEENGIRVIANIGFAERNIASAYGFIVTSEKILNDKFIAANNFTFESDVAKVSGYCYIKEGDTVTTDIINDLGDDASVYFSAFLKGIPESQRASVLVMRPFVKVGNSTFYGAPVSTSVDELTAK